MEEKYIKFYKTFHKKFKNNKNLIHCLYLLSDRRMIMKRLLVFLILFASYSYASESHWKYGSGLGSKSHWKYGSGLGSKSHWNYGSGLGSKSHWNYGSGFGSKSQWNYGSGTGSKSQWNYGSGTGSKSQWNYGSGTGSKSQWKYGSGQGSKSHWKYGSGRTFNNSPFIDLCLGLISDGEDSPKFCSIYPNLSEML